MAKNEEFIETKIKNHAHDLLAIHKVYEYRYQKFVTLSLSIKLHRDASCLGSGQNFFRQVR
jgi:hypothetical protein